MWRLSATVLGSAAGGGYPQWNCRCTACQLVWGGDARVKRRTQTSIAISADRTQWTLLNASPDLREQIIANRVLHPLGATRTSPITDVVLTGGEIDQIAGLLSLRERQPFRLHATDATLAILKDNPIFSVLDDKLVERRRVSVDSGFSLCGGLRATVFPVPGKVPLFLEQEETDIGIRNGAAVGVEIEADAASARLVFVPAAAAMTAELHRRLARADVILFDGTLFTDDEMICTGTGTKSGRRMGHMPIDGLDGSLEALRHVSARRIFIHINNTNPILIQDSPAYQAVRSAGWEIAEDGQEIVL